VLVAAVASLAATVSACSANVAVRVDVVRSGHGSVTVTVTVPRATADEIEDLSAGLPLADLRAAGWVVAGPGPGATGSTVVKASHKFSDLSEIPVLVADIAGSGPLSSRPFRLSVVEQKMTLHDRFVATGIIDLRCAWSCFDDPHLAKTVGAPLGLPPGELKRILGVGTEGELSFDFAVSLPGRVTASNAPRTNGQAPNASAKPGSVPEGQQSWAPALGGALRLMATSESPNLTVLRQLVAGLSGGALLVLLTALALLLRHRRRRLTTVTVTTPQ
jgi:hypothetical protein